MTEQKSVIFNKNIILTFSKPVTKEDFVLKIKEIVKDILNLLRGNGSNNLGHIKFISTTNGEDYLQVSVLDINQDPKVEGFLKKAFEKIKITLNIIAFGVKKEEIDKKLDKELEKLQFF